MRVSTGSGKRRVTITSGLAFDIFPVTPRAFVRS
jgi:hypothetical protein